MIVKLDTCYSRYTVSTISESECIKNLQNEKKIVTKFEIKVHIWYYDFMIAVSRIIASIIAKSEHIKSLFMQKC